MYFCLCESRHYDHVLNIVDKKNYNKLLKSDDYNILFSKKYDKSFMRNKSFLIEIPFVDIEIKYGKDVDASEYDIKFIEQSHIYKKCDNEIIKRKELDKTITDKEFSNWLDEYYTSLKTYSPKYNYKDDYIYFLLESDGKDHVVNLMQSFCSANKEIHNEYND